MKLKDLKSVGASDELNKIQEYTDQALRPVLGCPLLDGVLLENVVLANGTTIVEHKLGRNLRGYIIVRKSADANIWNSTPNKRSITLSADAECTVSIWCF